MLSGFVDLSAAEHRVDAGYGVERLAGPLFGAGVGIAHGRLALSARARGGTLSPGGGSVDQDVGEIGAELRVRAAPWIAFGVGAERRSYSSVLARQRWTMVHVGVEASLPFASPGLRGLLGGALVPVVSIPGLPAPDVAFSAAAGLEYARGRASLGMIYALERYDFASSGAGPRLEQLSSLMLRVGVRRGGA